MLRRLFVERKTEPLAGSSSSVARAISESPLKLLCIRTGAPVDGLEPDVDFEIAVEGEHGG